MPTLAAEFVELEEHELPSIEAVLAGTLALMTGYSQALQAAAHPQQRLVMGRKISAQLALLVDHPQLSGGFREVLAGLAQRWCAMSACTEAAAQDCEAAGPGAMPEHRGPEHRGPERFRFDAPKRLQ